MEWNQNPYTALKSSPDLKLKWNHSSDKFFFLAEFNPQSQPKTQCAPDEAPARHALDIIQKTLATQKQQVKDKRENADKQLALKLERVLAKKHDKESDRIGEVQKELVEHEQELGRCHVKLSVIYDSILLGLLLKYELGFDTSIPGIHAVYAREKGKETSGRKVGTFYLGEYRFMEKEEKTLNPVYVNLANGREYVKDRFEQFVPRYITRGVNDDDARGLGDKEALPIKPMLDWKEAPSKNEASWYELQSMENAELEFADKAISQIRGQKRFISATKSKRMMTSTRGVGFESIFGTVTLDLAALQRKHILDASQPKAMEEIFLKQLQKKVDFRSEVLEEQLGELQLMDLPHWGALSQSTSALVKNTVLAARDVWRTREVLIKGSIPKEAILCEQSKRDTSVLVLKGMPSAKGEASRDEREKAKQLETFFENELRGKLTGFGLLALDEITVLDVMVNLQRKAKAYDARCAYLLLEGRETAGELQRAIGALGDRLSKDYPKREDQRRKTKGIALLGKALGTELTVEVLPPKYYGYVRPERFRPTEEQSQ